MKHRLLLLFAALLIGALGVWRVFLYAPPWSADMFVRQVRAAMMRDPQQGWATARQAMRVYPDDPNVLTLAAEAAARAEHVTDMIDIVTRNAGRLLSADVPPGSATIHVLIDNGYHRAAQRLLDDRLSKDPDDPFAVRTRSDLLLRHGRHFLATGDLRHLLLLGEIQLDELVFLSSRREFLEDKMGLDRAAAQDPEFIPVIVGLGSLAATQGNLQDATALLQKATSSNQAPAEAWAALGLVYYRLGLISKELQTWRESVRAREFNHPDIHFVTGWMAAQEGAYRDSVRDLCRAVQLAPLHRPACQLVSELLAQYSRAGMEAEFFSERAAVIHELEQLAHSVLFGDRSFTSMEKLAQLCEQLGESRLAEAWWKAADLFRPKSGRHVAALRESQQRNSVRQSMAVTDRLQLLLSRGITDQFQIANRTDQTSPQPGMRSGSESSTELQFHDVAASVGIVERYFGGFDGPPAGLWIYQGFGGGVAVIDFDGDDAPDLCFTQASDWPSGNELPWNHQDLLYRNRVGVFDQVNRLAFDSEHSFGQGVAVGDADRDGFPDLYVANIGPNRLLINNGDGTFRSVDLPVTSESPPGWTTSCLLADLDADGFDDLYDVQYVEGTDPFKRICHSGPEGAVRGCLPSLFNPAHDEFLHNQGDGRFAVQTRSSGLSELKGRGLGILAANLDGDPGLEVFVSNDMTSNHFLKIRPTETGVRFTDHADSLGLAGNGEGQVEACMGIAAADVSGDGALDLFVTNFFEETNTYYESQPGGFFRDQTRIAKLGAVSLKQLGFGSQLLDADLDGDWDLLVANGHIDDYRHSGIPWKMTCDLLQNTGRSGFLHCNADNLGGYGEIGVLGRAMARVDWNRDGLPDAIITHLDRPPALLENRTHTRHHSLSLRLTGTASNRPAVGAVLTISLGDQDLVLQCVAGDGYYCSNDKTLLVGTGQLAVVPRIVIRWPSGAVQEFLDVQTDCRIRAIEGHDVLYTICP